MGMTSHFSAHYYKYGSAKTVILPVRILSLTNRLPILPAIDNLFDKKPLNITNTWDSFSFSDTEEEHLQNFQLEYIQKVPNFPYKTIMWWVILGPHSTKQIYI